MELGTAGKELIESFEELRLAAYPDQRGIPTIGYGHTGRDVYLGLTCTQAQADAWLALDTHIAVACVNHVITKCVGQNEFDALVSLTFNIGSGNFQNSSIARAINAGDAAQEQHYFEEWNHTNGVVNDGLVRRRAAEWALFVTR